VLRVRVQRSTQRVYCVRFGAHGAAPHKNNSRQQLQAAAHDGARRRGGVGAEVPRNPFAHRNLGRRGRFGTRDLRRRGVVVGKGKAGPLEEERDQPHLTQGGWG
jgi:hypothetical protein